MKNLILIVLTYFFSQSIFAQVEGYKIPVVRNGVKTTQLVYNFWSGEYPGPVIDVTQDMTINAYASVRTLNEVKKCTIEKGLYHPWSQTQNSIELFYTIIDVVSYQALNDTTLEEAYDDEDNSQALTIKKGEKVTNEIYLSEGWCTGTLVTLKGEKSAIYYMCGEVSDNPAFKQTSKKGLQDEDGFYEQWMYLTCAEGYKAFVQDEALLSMPNVKEGEIKGYGEVGSVN